jgi:hypothetical protein
MSTLRARLPSEQVDAALMEAEGDIGPWRARFEGDCLRRQ